MQEDYRNIYKTGRAEAGLTQEQAAELLDVSVESVRAYETGQRVPPDSTVRLMADLYGVPWLLLEHARATDELGVIPPDARARPIAQATVSLCRYMLEWSERQRARQLLRIAEDGLVDEAERPLFDEIACELEGIAAAWLSLRCSPDIKEERPGLAGPKRSRSQKPENCRKSVVMVANKPRHARIVDSGGG